MGITDIKMKKFLLKQGYKEGVELFEKIDDELIEAVKTGKISQASIQNGTAPKYYKELFEMNQKVSYILGAAIEKDKQRLESEGKLADTLSEIDNELVGEKNHEEMAKQSAERLEKAQIEYDELPSLEGLSKIVKEKVFKGDPDAWAREREEQEAELHTKRIENIKEVEFNREVEKVRAERKTEQQNKDHAADKYSTLTEDQRLPDRINIKPPANAYAREFDKKLEAALAEGETTK